jgi:hypothetical protein
MVVDIIEADQHSTMIVELQFTSDLIFLSISAIYPYHRFCDCAYDNHDLI